MEQTGEKDPSEVVLCDLDGVVWLSHEPIDGAPEAVRLLRSSGRRVLFVTNNSHPTTSEIERRLDAVGIPAVGDVVTSAQAAARLLRGDESVLVCGGPGIVEEVARRGCRVSQCHKSTNPEDVYDAVVVGFHREFDYAVMDKASAAIRAGARFIATNLDPTYPTPSGLIPGGGAIVSAISTASGSTPVVAGKPHLPLAQVVRELCPDIPPSRMLMVGDRLSTDKEFAAMLGCRFALVLSGVSGFSDVVHADIWGEALIDVARRVTNEGEGSPL